MPAVSSKPKTTNMKRLYLAAGILAASTLVLASCSKAEPIATSPDDAPAVTRATSWNDFARVVYVEVNDVNPLNAGEYTIEDGTPFFTHVILFASNIRGDANGNVFNYNNPNNEAILTNPSTYIAPLQSKGIKVLMGNLGDHTGAGFSNLTAAQIDSYTDDLVAYESIVDGWDFDDEWADYGKAPYPGANTTSFSNMLIALNGKTDKMITVFDWGLSSNISAAAANCVDLAYYGALNGYGAPSFLVPMSRYCPYFIDLTGPDGDGFVKTQVNRAKNANAGGVCFFNLPMSAYRLSTLNAAAQAFGHTVSHSGKTYPKNYGN